MVVVLKVKEKLLLGLVKMVMKRKGLRILV